MMINILNPEESALKRQLISEAETAANNIPESPGVLGADFVMGQIRLADLGAKFKQALQDMDISTSGLSFFTAEESTMMAKLNTPGINRMQLTLEDVEGIQVAIEECVYLDGDHRATLKRIYSPAALTAVDVAQEYGVAELVLANIATTK